MAASAEVSFSHARRAAEHAGGRIEQRQGLFCNTLPRSCLASLVNAAMGCQPQGFQNLIRPTLIPATPMMVPNDQIMNRSMRRVMASKR